VKEFSSGKMGKFSWGRKSYINGNIFIPKKRVKNEKEE